ncbi:MAG: DUF362 domain-containing protein [Planctomycetes bacterium]|nr:DUF362 domain-containing protein [Planctomycetota bacterium]
MDRRDFLKAGVAAGIGLGLGSVGSIGSFSSSGAVPIIGGARGFGTAAAGEPGLPDIVAVRNGEPDQMFDSGIAAMGGMRRFVRQGQTVCIKPNISWDSGPEHAANTHPALVRRIIQHCFDAGARSVVVFDHCIEHWQRCYQSSGIAEAVGDAGGTMAPAEAERYYQQTTIRGGVNLKQAKIHEAMLEADVLISVPVLKHHGGAGITASLKNFMGAVWDRRTYHASGLQQCIADFATVRRPDLSVVDAYRCLMNNGPRSRSLADVRLMKMQIISTDIVAADASAARLMGRQPDEYAHIRIAHQMGLGQIDPNLLVNRRISL